MDLRRVVLTCQAARLCAEALAVPETEVPRNLPVFPLNTVLFPGMPLSLRIFEERYKEMLADLPAVGNRFVVALIKSGEEVGEAAEPHLVGCVAEVVHSQPTPGDTFFVHAIGRARVRLEGIDSVSRPYLTAGVSEWPEEQERTDPKVVEIVRARFEAYARVLASLAGHEPPDFRPPSQPVALSWLVATVVQMPPEQRQQLMEVPSTAERLATEARLLRVELPLVRALLSAPRPPDPGTDKFSAN